MARLGIRRAIALHAQGLQHKMVQRFCSERKKGAFMAINFVPLHDRILVRRIEEQEKTPGGLIIPDTAKDKPQEGEILTVGKGKINEDGKILPLDVRPGERILFGKYADNEIILEGEEYLIMREDEVLGILGKATTRTKVAA